jgi:hypothetical protein
MYLNDQNVRVVVNGTELYVTNINYSFKNSFEKFQNLGDLKVLDQLSNGPIEGTINIDYIVTGNDVGVSLFEYILLGNNYGYTSITIGNKTFSESYLNSHKLNAQINSVINGSLSFTVFNNNSGPLTTQTYTASSTSSPAHASQSSIGITNSISFDYSATVEWEPVYIVGNLNAQNAIFKGAQQSLDIKGYNLAPIISKCESKQTVNISLATACGGSLTNFYITDAKVQNSETSLKAGGYVEGSYSIIKMY